MIQIKKNEMGGICGIYGGTGEVDTGFWWGHLREGDSLENLGVDGRIILEFMCKVWDRETSSGLLWLKIGRGGGLL